MDVKRQLELLERNLDGMPGESTFGRYIAWLNRQIEKKSELFKHVYEPIILEEEPYRGKHAPFLTVVTRTQGKRPEMLRETLLSLNGQRDGDFEVVLIGHKLDAQQEKLVKQVIWEQPDDFRKKIRFIKLDTGNRTAPLNLGFAHARGSYVAILDDDDLALDNWVEEFHKAGMKYSGRILHAYVFGQEWMTVPTDSGVQALRAVKAPKADYCSKFDFLIQMRMNNCPPVGLAFPAFYFQKLGLIFDERLTTTEDWDYLMRVAFLAGVKDIETATAIYRLWVNAESSATVHSQREWKKNYLLITEKIMDMPVLIPQGSRKSVAQESMSATMEGRWPYRAPFINWCSLYLNRGGRGFCQSEVLTCHAMSNGAAFDAVFQLEEALANDICEIRFDVCEEGMFVIQNVVALVQYWDGSSEMLAIEDCRCNGARAAGAICFLNSDPWMIWQVDRRKKLKYIRVIGETHVNMTPELVQSACRSICGTEFQLFYRTKNAEFCEADSCHQYAPNGFFQLSFPVDSEETITALRLDPGENVGCILRNLQVELVDQDGKTTRLPTRAGQTNGTWEGNWVIFNCLDPQIVWSVHPQKLSKVKISGTFDNYAAEEDAFQQQTKPNLLSRIWARLKKNG